MQISTEGIVIRRIRYGESGNIVHIFTRSDGMRHFIVKSGKRGNSGALFLPLTQLEFVMTSGRDNALGYLKDIKISYPYRTLYQDVKKSAVSIFLAEVLSHALQSESQNATLFDFMRQELQKFDLAQENPDFHILFLLDITEYLGFCPQRGGDNVSYAYFDLQDGCFCEERPFHNNYFEGDKARLFGNLVHKREVGKRLPLLEALLSYYRIHVATSGNIHSLSILHEVFL
jgi:DNA repair protein RecO (recombination protein O)